VKERDRPSRTAEFVAASRGLGWFLPDALQLVDDPYGLRFTRYRALREVPRAQRVAQDTSRFWLRGMIRTFVVYMQTRTRVIDDDVDAFARGGGKQLVLWGAGFDCRAWRLASLSGATVFEVDHPATQAKKRAVMGGEQPFARVKYVPWDFERDPVSALPARLAACGHDPHAPTMTIVEGVLMYLTTEAIDATFGCVASYTPPGSPLAITYMEPVLVDGTTGDAEIRRRLVRFVGEPFRSGFEPAALPAWLESRRFRLVRDESGREATARLMPGHGPGATRGDYARTHFALTRRV